MSDEDLELLITLDDPGGAPEEDTFAHLQLNNIEYWLGRRSGWAHVSKGRDEHNEMLFAFVRNQ